MIQFYLIGFGQSLLFTLLILTKKPKKLSDYILSFYIFLLGVYLLFVYFYFTGLYKEYPAIVVADIFYWVLLGPMLLFYIKLITSGKNKFDKSLFLYLIPTLIVIVGFRQYIFVDPLSFFDGGGQDNLLFAISFKVWMYNSPIFYILSIWLIRKHSKRIKQYYSYSKNVDLKWLYYLANGFAVYLIFILTSGYIRQFLFPELPSSYSYTWFILVVYIFGIGFFGYKQKGIFSDFEVPTNTERLSSRILAHNGYSASSISDNNMKGTYEKSGLSKEDADDLSDRLIHLMKTEQPFLDCEINLSSLANKLDTTTHKLSQVINETIGKNFFEFINDYRVENAKKSLVDPKFNNYKILTLAFECGFNSKSTFYTVFKKSTSLTPAEYKQKHQP